ncbi:MAG: fibronectin type III domain-containing protein [Candidatus Nomurabacteria bacterium]|nr:MAG: fibronectin type III domain-containing protein [Candidatus Nomurabacteria bacterium]HRV75819.1 fibronectin type III domain-containing protein [Candidatus Saccharimonadales bacterium]
MVGPSTLTDSYFQGTVEGDSKVGGIVGEIGSGPTDLANTYSEAIITANSLSGGISGSGSQYYGTDNFASSSLTVGQEVEPWDFDEIWYIRPGNFPGLRPVELPTLICEAPNSTDNSISGSCTSTRTLEGGTVWELQYKAVQSDQWLNLSSQNGTEFDVTINGLLEGTDYQIRFRYVDNIGTSPWGVVEATTTGDSDLDGDGTANITEALSPNDGDANDDGTPDYQQSNVITYINPLTNDYAVFEAANCTSIAGFQVGSESSEKADSQYTYPMGLASFHITCDEPGTTATIRHYFYGVEGSETYTLRKWMPDGSYKAFLDYNLLGLPLEEQTVFFVQYQITDGGEFDDDGTADGVVRDPSGLAQLDNIQTLESNELASTGSSSLIYLFFSLALIIYGVKLGRKTLNFV